MSTDSLPQYYQLLFDGKLFEARAQAETALKNSSTEDETKDHTMGLCHILNELKEFETSHRLLMDLAEHTGDHRILHNLGAVKRMLGRFPEALDVFERETDLLVDSEDSLSLATNLYELAKTKHMLDRSQDATLDALECFTQAQKTDDPIMKGCSFRLLGDLFFRDPDISFRLYDEAIIHFNKGMDPRAVEDIAQRKKSIIVGENPKFIS